MTDEAPLLAAICRHPDDNTPRLMYADWLDEHAGTLPCPTCSPCTKDPRVAPGRVPVIDPNGHGPGHPKAWWEDCKRCGGSGRVPDGRAARAEFIRVQCELARRGPCPATIYHPGIDDPPEHPWKRGGPPLVREKKPCGWCPVCALRRRERELWQSGALFHILDQVRPAKAIPEEMVLYLDGDRPNYTPRKPEGYVRRGFVEALALSAADWFAHEASLCWTPPVRCPKCHGSRVEVDWRQRRPVKGPCPECLGEGTVPTLTDPCPGCGHTAIRGEVLIHDPPTPGRPEGSWSPKKCPRCRGKGTVPRPMPPTAQPITRVTLPNLSIHPGNVPVGCPITFHGYPVVMTGENSFTCDRWPGITFDLSTAAPG